MRILSLLSLVACSSAAPQGDYVPAATIPERLFPDGSVWFEDLSAGAVDPTSDTVIRGLQAHGWGFDRFQIDFSIDVAAGPDPSVAMVAFVLLVLEAGLRKRHMGQSVG